MKSILIVGLLFLFMIFAERVVVADDCHSKIFGPSLVPPKTVEGIPEAGKRVRVYLDHYPGVYYVLYLPYNFKSSEEWPVIFESPGNPSGTPIGSLSGAPDDTYLGYGLSEGQNFIWVSVPFLNETGDKVQVGWWGRDENGAPTTTVNYWLAVLEDLNKKFHIRQDEIVIAGFSRGAIADSYMGNWNDIISSKWAAYFADAHFDGTVWGGYNSEERLNRIGDRKVLITVGELDTGAKGISVDAYAKLIQRESMRNTLKSRAWGILHTGFWRILNLRERQGLGCRVC